jgi:hypothetical protein
MPPLERRVVGAAGVAGVAAVAAEELSVLHHPDLALAAAPLGGDHADQVAVGALDQHHARAGEPADGEVAEQAGVVGGDRGDLLGFPSMRWIVTQQLVVRPKRPRPRTHS